MEYSVPQNISSDKIFLTNFSELEGRWDPLYYASNFSRFFKHQYCTQLKNVCLCISSGFGAGKDDQSDEKNGYIQIRPTNIDNNGELIFDRNVYVPLQDGADFVTVGTVLFNNTNSQELVGKTAVLLEEKQLYTSNHITSIVVDESKISAEYLWIVLNTYQRNKVFYTLCTNWNNQSGIGLNVLKSLKIPVLPFPIQKQIVDKYHSALRLRRKKMNESQNKILSIDTYLLKELQIALPKDDSYDLKDRMFTVSFKDVISGRFDPKFYSKQVNDLKLSILKSPFDKRPLISFIENERPGDWGEDENNKKLDFSKYTKCLTLRATELDNRYNLKLDNSRAKYRYILNTTLKEMDIKPNDLLIEKSGGSEDQPVGRIAFLTEDILSGRNIAYSNFLHKITVKGINPQYLYYYLKLMHNIGLTDSMQSQTNGIRNLIMSEYKNQIIIVPDEQKQNEIVSVISQIRAEAKKLEMEGDGILKQAMADVEDLIFS